MIRNKIQKVIFYNIFLILIGCHYYEVNANSYNYGNNTLTQDIEFIVEVQDSLLVAYDTELAFGEILKGSTGKILAEAEIKVESGGDISFVSAQYLTGSLEKDGTRKLEIKNIEKESIGDTKEEREILDVYFYPFKEKYQITEFEGKKGVNILVQAEIRDTVGVKLGNYEGNMEVQILIVGNNNKLREI